MKPLLHLQQNLFWEEENNSNYIDIIKQYFDILPVSTNVWQLDKLAIHNFRGSLNIAQFLKRDYKFADCRNWIPIFRKYVLSPHHTYFNDIGYFANYYSAFEFPLYLRPADPYKSFAGQVFQSKEKLLEEYNYLTKNLNFDNSLMCVSSPIKKIDREWRTVFIDQKYVSGCLYMQGKDYVEVSTEIPYYVIEFAQKISSDDYFTNVRNFVIDICQSNGSLYLLEINSFESSSFYGCDLDKIYSTWAKQIQNDG